MARCLLVQHGDGGQARYGVANREDLRLVVGVVGEGGGEVGSGADEVHGVFQIHVVVVARHRVHHAADFQHGHIGDGKLGPGGELQGDNVAGFHALGDKPCGHTPGFVVNLPVGEAASRVVADVFAVGVSGTRSLPDVGDGVVRPIPLGVPTFSQRLVDLQVVDHVSPFCSLIGRYQSPGGPNLMATIIQTMEPKRS